jgi:hypothetical protein
LAIPEPSPIPFVPLSKEKSRRVDSLGKLGDIVKHYNMETTVVKGEILLERHDHPLQ